MARIVAFLFSFFSSKVKYKIHFYVLDGKRRGKKRIWGKKREKKENIQGRQKGDTKIASKEP